MVYSYHIKSMVCDRCKTAVEAIFKSVGKDPIHITLGEVKVLSPISDNSLPQLDRLLKEQGFERIDDKRSRLLEQVKTTIIEVIHHRDQVDMKINWSHFLSEKFNHDYDYLSHLFSTVVGTTIEQYIIGQRVEKVKEYLFYDELVLKEIAFKLGYSSVAHLSSQFKKVTGLTPTQFKAARTQDIRKSLDSI